MADGLRPHSPDLPPPVPLAERRGDRSLRDRPAGRGPGSPAPARRHPHLGEDHRGAQPRAGPRAGARPHPARSDLLQPPRRVVAPTASWSRPWPSRGRRVPTARSGPSSSAGASSSTTAASSWPTTSSTATSASSTPRGARAAAATSRPSTRMETPDKYTLRVHTKQPSASLLAGMAGGWSSIIPKEVVEEKGRPSPDRRRDGAVHLPGMGAPELPQGAEESRLLGQGQAVHRRPRAQGHPGRGEHHRPASHGQRPPRPPRGQQELPPGQGRQATHRPPGAPAGLRHGDDQPRAEALHRRPRAPGDQPRRRPDRGAPGGGLRPRVRDGPADAGHEALGASRGDVQGVVHAEPGAREEAPGRRRASRRASRRR